MTDTPIVPPRPYPSENTPANNPPSFATIGPNYPGQNHTNALVDSAPPNKFDPPHAPLPLTSATPTNPPVAKVNHLSEIAELARNLHNASPSGAETASAKILDHVSALQDPKAYDARIAAQNKVENDAHAARVKAKADAKTGKL